MFEHYVLVISVKDVGRERQIDRQTETEKQRQREMGRRESE